MLSIRTVQCWVAVTIMSLAMPAAGLAGDGVKLSQGEKPGPGPFQCSEGETVEIGAEDGFFPYTGIYNGSLKGFSRDLVAAAYERAGCNVSFKVLPYARCMRAVENGTLSGCFNTTDSEENRQKYIFHDSPLFRGKIRIYAHPGRDLGTNPIDFNHDTFAVVRGYTYTDEFDGNPDITKVNLESDFQTLALVSKGRADFAVVYERVADFHLSNGNRRLQPRPVPVALLTEFDLFVSFTRKDGEQSRRLAQLLDFGLGQIRANGTYAKIESDWVLWLSREGAQSAAPPYFPFGGAGSDGGEETAQ